MTKLEVQKLSTALDAGLRCVFYDKYLLSHVINNITYVGTDILINVNDSGNISDIKTDNVDINYKKVPADRVKIYGVIFNNNDHLKSRFTKAGRLKYLSVKELKALITEYDNIKKEVI